MQTKLGTVLNSPRAYDLAGVALASQGYLADAVNYFKKSLQLDPDNEAALLNLETALLAMGTGKDS